jgi:rhomboid protease GluP
VTYDLVLLGVMIGAGYWGAFFVRQRPYGTATFGVMQLAAAVLCGLGFLGRRFDVAWLGIAGAIGIGAGMCLLVIGPLARFLARQLAASERISFAMRLLDLAELLAPGSGVAEEKALVRAMAEIREGRIEQTVDALTLARERASAEARLAIDERIAMLYLAAYRWTDAIAHAETHLFGAPPLPGRREDDGSLRQELGIAPPVWVDLLGAYGRVGDLDRAARMLARLEDVCVGRDDAALWIHRGRMMFLALAGRTEAVRVLVAPQRSRHMTPAARTYWMAIARLGDSRRAEPGAVASEVVARVEAAPLPPPIRVTRPRRVRATWALTAIVLAVAAVAKATVGSTGDLGVLIRAGAMVHGMVAAGEWWRVISCLFVHVGTSHLWLNAFGLLVIGWLAEDLFGASRMISIFALAGIAGALASYFAAPGGISAGASGAVFGLVGALFVELTWHRQRYRVAWKRGMWGALAVIAIGQLAFGFFFPAIDQWAHGAGLAAGAVLGAALSPSVKWARAGLTAGRVVAVGFAGVAVVAWILVLATPIADSLAGQGVTRRVNDEVHVAIQAPSGWLVSTDQGLNKAHQVVRLYADFTQPDSLVVTTVSRAPATALAEQLDRWAAEQSERYKEQLGKPAVTEPSIPLPAGWTGRELAGSFEDDMEYRQRVRMVVCGRVFDDQVIFAAILVPETIATAAPEFFARLLASIGPA